MKKKVRIYRAPDGQGAIINKTSKFLKKAQQGGMPDPSQMGYPGQQAAQEEMSQDQLAQSIITDISNGRPKEETVIKLVNIFGQEPMMADQYYEQIYAALNNRQESAEEEADEDSPSKPIQEDIEQEQVIEESFGYPDPNEELSNEIASEDDDVDYGDDDQVASDIIMQFGGVSPVIVPIRQDGGEAYPIQFPGVEAYLPPNMEEILSGQTDVLTGQAWSPVDESQAGVAPDEEVDNSYRTGGQYKKDKRVYVNSMMKLAKKQMGGEDMSKKGDTDFRGEDVRKERLNSFLGTVKNEAQLAKTKEQAEQQFDQMMQQQQMQQQYPMEQPMAQFGMQMGRGFFGRPRMPRGVGFGYGMPISKIDVRRTGVFGRPKEYSIEFGASPMPGMPGSGAGFYGYGQTTKKTGKSKGRIITEEVSKTINSASTDEVAKNTPGNTATNKPTLEEMRKAAAAAGYDPWSTTSTDVVDNSTASNIKENSATSNKRKGVEVNNEATDAALNNSNAKREETKKYFTREELGAEHNDLRYNKNRKDAAYIVKDGKYYIAPSYRTDPAGEEKYYEVTDPSRIEQIKKFKSDQSESFQGLKGSEYEYIRDEFGDWEYFDEKAKEYKPVTNPESLKRLKNNENIKNYAAVLKDKPGYYYRERNDGAYVKFKGDPEKHNADKKPIEVITKKDKKRHDYIANTETEGYLLKFGKGPNKKSKQDIRTGKFFETFEKQEGGAQYYNPFGGFVDSDNPDLYKFIYGGNDPYFTQEDLDDVYSKDTSDPYFQNGGGYEDYRKRVGDKLQMLLRDDLSAKELFEMGQKAGIDFGDNNTTTTTKKKTTTTDYEDYNPYGNVGYNGFNVFGNLFPANIASYQGSWGKVKKGPYNPRTGMAIPGMGFGPNTQISSIDVKRSGMFGRPKKYTINYSNQQMDPRKQNLITVPGQGASSSTTTPGSQGYSGQDPATQKQGNRFSNTKGLKAGTRAKVAMKELFNRYNDEEEVPETNVDIDQSPKRKTPELIKMDIKRPGLVSPSENLVRAKYEESVRKAGSRADQERPIGNPAYEERNRRISPSKEQLEKLYNRDVFQNGGDLKRFLGGVSRFQPGGYVNQTPVVFTDNPAHVGMSNVEMISLNEGIPDLKPSSFWQDQASFNEEVPVNTQKQPEQIKMDPTQVSSDQAKKAYQATPGDFSIDVKNKNMYEVDPEAALNVANAGIRGVTGMMDRMRNKKREAKMYENLTADNLYASDPSRDRGDYDANTGLYRPDSQGATHTSRSKKYGGDSNYSEGDVIDMSEEELAEFLANGGEVEYLNY